MSRRANRVSEAVGLAVAEGLGVAVVGFLGAELMLAPAGATLSTFEGLAPALAAGIGVGLYRFTRYAPHPAPVEQPEPDARRWSPSTEFVTERGAWSRR